MVVMSRIFFFYSSLKKRKERKHNTLEWLIVMRGWIQYRGDGCRARDHIACSFHEAFCKTNKQTKENFALEPAWVGGNLMSRTTFL